MASRTLPVWGRTTLWSSVSQPGMLWGLPRPLPHPMPMPEARRRGVGSLKWTQAAPTHQHLGQPLGPTVPASRALATWTYPRVLAGLHPHPGPPCRPASGLELPASTSLFVTFPMKVFHMQAHLLPLLLSRFTVLHFSHAGCFRHHHTGQVHRHHCSQNPCSLH